MLSSDQLHKNVKNQADKPCAFLWRLVAQSLADRSGDSPHSPSAAADLHLIFSSGSCEGMLSWFTHLLLYRPSHQARSPSALLHTSWSHRDITSSELPLSAAGSSSLVPVTYHTEDGVHLKYTLQLKFLPEQNTTCILKAATMTWPPSRTSACAGPFHLCW